MKSTLAIILSIIFLGCSGDPKDVLVDSPNAKDSISEICKDLSEKECNLLWEYFKIALSDGQYGKEGKVGIAYKYGVKYEDLTLGDVLEKAIDSDVSGE
ncbi:MAG: hypothetical protein ACI8Q1_002597 [Parvicella sp.]|jgi:hypothetical protein